jgi:hypothetical protein
MAPISLRPHAAHRIQARSAVRIRDRRNPAQGGHRVGRETGRCHRRCGGANAARRERRGVLGGGRHRARRHPRSPVRTLGFGTLLVARPGGSGSHLQQDWRIRHQRRLRPQAVPPAAVGGRVDGRVPAARAVVGRRGAARHHRRDRARALRRRAGQRAGRRPPREDLRTGLLPRIRPGAARGRRLGRPARRVARAPAALGRSQLQGSPAAGHRGHDARRAVQRHRRTHRQRHGSGRLELHRRRRLRQLAGRARLRRPRPACGRMRCRAPPRS